MARSLAELVEPVQGDGGAASSAWDEIDLARAAEYDLMAVLLAQAPDRDLLAALARIEGDGTALGQAHARLAAAAQAADPARVEREFFNLFIGLGQGELLPYASFYLTGFLHERPLARLRADLARLGIERSETLREPEDHIALLFDVMAGLAGGRFGAEPAEEARFFERHLKPWAGRFFEDLGAAASADFYQAVAACGITLLQVEAEAFTMAA